MEFIPAESYDELHGTWTQNVTSLPMNHGMHPIQLPVGAFSVVSGVRANSTGAARKELGFRLWADLNCDGRWLADVQRCTDWDDYLQFIGPAVVEPFSLRQYGNATEGVSGLYIQTIGLNRYWLVTQVEGYHDPLNPNGPIIHMMPRWSPSSTKQANAVKAGTAHTADNHLVISNGYWMYVFGQLTPHWALWFSDSLFAAGDAADETAWGGPGAGDSGGTFGGWRADYLGIPDVGEDATQGLYLFLPDNFINNPGGNMIAGGYVILPKLYDPIRKRTTGLGGRDYVSNQNAYSQFIDAADADYVVLQLKADNVMLGPNYENNVTFWQYYQIWSTLSSQVSGQDPPEVLYYGDQMDIDDDWVGDYAAPTLNECYLFKTGARNDSAAAHDTMPLTDGGLAGSGRTHDYLQDEFRKLYATDASDWSMNHVYAAIHSQGCMMVLLNPTDEGPILAWSDLRDFRDESFPRANTYNLSFSTLDNAQFAEAASYTFLFADGRVYAIQRNEQYLDVVEILQGFQPVSRHAVTTANGVIIGVFESGCYLLDTVSGTPTPITQIDRLLQDRWADGNLRSNIQVAYDATLDCVFVLCPGAAQIACFWLKTNTVSLMDGANFTYVRELRTIDDSGVYTQRAMFVTHFGKIVYPVRNTDSSDEYTMHGLGRGQYPDAPTVYQAKVTALGTSEGSSSNYDYTDITLVDESGAAYEFNPEMMQGITIAVLDGDLRGTIWQTGLQNITVLNGDDAQGTTGNSIFSLDGSPSLASVTTDCYIRVEGTTDGDVYPDLYSIVSVNDGADQVTVNAVFSADIAGKRWTIVTPGKTSTLRLWGHISDHTDYSHTDLRGCWIAISPVPMTLIGAPLQGVTTQSGYDRKEVGACSYNITRLRGTDSDRLTNFAMIRMGVCTIDALFSGEPVAVPTSAWHSDTYGPQGLIPGPAPLPRFIDLTDAGVILTDAPALGTAPTENLPAENIGYLDQPYGFSGPILCPVIISDVSGVSFDLTSFSISGTIFPADVDTSEDS